MKKIIRIITGVVVVVLTLTAGVLIGSNLENSKQENIKGELFNGTKIAVVNLDEGVTYQFEQKNYAKELMNNYSENYVLAGLSDAKKGITDGRYAAYVIIPSDFSTNLVSVNAVPNKSLLKYEISGDLSQNATDKAWQSVMQLKENINDDVGYVYISSILGEFHNGQDNAVKVLSNDNKDKEVLMAISNLDLVAALDLHEVERLKNNIENLDISTDVEKNKEIIAAIDTAYKGYLGETSQQLSDLQNASIALNKDNLIVKQSADNIRNLVNEDGSKNYDVANMAGLIDQFNTGLSSQQKEILDTLMSSSHNETLSKQAYVSEKQSGIDTLVDEMQKSYESLNKIQWTTFKSDVTKIFEDEHNDFEMIAIVYPTIEKLFEDERLKEPVKNAENYIDKVILNQFMSIDYTKPDLTYDTLIQEIMIKLKTDKKLQTSLNVYAISIGKTDEEAEKYSLKDYLDKNKEAFNTLPEIDSTKKSDQLKSDIKTAIEKDIKIDIKNVLENHDISLKTEVETLVDAQTPSDIKADAKDTIDAYRKSIEGISEFQINETSDLIKEIIPINSTDLQSMVDLDLQDLTNEQINNKQSLLAFVDAHEVLNYSFHESLSIFDPLKNIKENEITGFVRDYDINIRKVHSEIENKNREYTTFVTDSYSNADEQVQSMKDDILKFQTESDTMITSGLENAKGVRDVTSGANNELMKGLISKLPYTRNGTVANNSVYDFIMTSSDIEGNKAESIYSKPSLNYTALFISVAMASILVLGTITVLSKTLKKSKES